MQNQLQVFQNSEFGELSVLMIGDKPYFPATECARILGYKNPQKAVRDHCKGVNESFTPSAGGLQKVKYIPEGDLYRLIIKSKLPSALKFEAWVMDDVLPTIRRFGFYATDAVLEVLAKNPQIAADIFPKLKAYKDKQLKALEGERLALLPKATYYDIVLQTENAIPITIIAKDYGLSAMRLNALLETMKIQYRRGKTWVLYQDYADKGYTKSRTYFVNETVASVQMHWTQKGRLFIYELLREKGLLPMLEQAYMGVAL